MKFRFGSVCSGIEAASVAFHPLGWRAAWLAEIEAFPSAALAHHYPDTPNLGDMTTIRERVEAGDVPAPDMLCGGTPCQSFSVAGLRKSLGDARGNLSLEFIRIADAIDRVRHAAGKPPAWILWENVPGVLSTSDNAFGAFLGGLCGGESAVATPDGGWPRAGVVAGPSRVVAWRVLDAQFFGLAQRRQRVFVLALGGARKWAAADALLPISDRMSWHPAPSRKAWQGTAAGTLRSTLGGSDVDHARAGHLVGGGDGVGGGELAGALTAKGPTAMGAPEVDAGHYIPTWPAEIAPTLNAAFASKQGLEDQHIRGGAGWFVPAEPQITHALRGEGFDASEDGTGRGTPLVPVTFRADAMREGTAKTLSPDAEGRMRLRDPGMGMYEDIAPTLDCGQPHGVAHAVGADMYNGRITGDIAATLGTQSGDGISSGPSVLQPIAFHPTQDPISSVDGTTHAMGCGSSGGVATIAVAEPLPFDTTQVTSVANRSNPRPGDACHPLAAEGHPPAIAFSAKDHGGDATVEMSPTLRAGGHTGSHANAGVMPAVAIGVNHANAQEAGPVEALRALQEAVGAEAFRHWCAGVAAALRSSEVLQQDLHGEGVRRQADEAGCGLDDGALPREEGGPSGAMREVWEAGRQRRTPQGRGLPEQLARELNAALSQLPHEGAQPAWLMQCLRSAGQGVGVLQSALPAAQGGTPAMQVRRLTPVECEKLQGFPPGYTQIPWRGKPASECPDGPRYKALGNSWAVPCARWIGVQINNQLEVEP